MLISAIDFAKIAERAIDPFKSALFTSFMVRYEDVARTAAENAPDQHSPTLISAYVDYRNGESFVNAYVPCILALEKALNKKDNTSALIELEDAENVLADELALIITKAYREDDTFEEAFKSIVRIAGIQSTYCVFAQFVDERIVRHWCENAPQPPSP